MLPIGSTVTDSTRTGTEAAPPGASLHHNEGRRRIEGPYELGRLGCRLGAVLATEIGAQIFSPTA